MLCKAKFSTEENINVFGKSAVAIHSLILRSTEVCRSVRLRARLKYDTFARDVSYLRPEFSSYKDVLGRFTFPMRGGSLYDFSQRIGRFSIALYTFV